jgi:hypothetical protein
MEWSKLNNTSLKKHRKMCNISTREIFPLRKDPRRGGHGFRGPSCSSRCIPEAEHGTIAGMGIFDAATRSRIMKAIKSRSSIDWDPIHLRVVPHI